MWFGPALQSKARDTHVCSPGGWLAVVAVAGCCWQLLAVAGSCWLLLAVAGCWLLVIAGGVVLSYKAELLKELLAGGKALGCHR
jgi:hypothetical protein